MTSFTPQQVAQLIGQGECFIHTHPKETLGFEDRLALMSAEPVSVIGVSEYTLQPRDELLLVDTSAGNVTITLPLAARGREFQIVKTKPQNVLAVTPTAPNAVLGTAAGVVVYNQWTSLHFKAVNNSEYILI